MKKIITLIVCYLILSSIGFGQWQQTNGPFGGDVRALAIDSATNNIYVGLNNGGVYMSSNNGGSWSNINNGLHNKTVYTIAISGRIFLLVLMVKVFLRQIIMEVVGQK